MIKIFNYLIQRIIIIVLLQSFTLLFYINFMGVNIYSKEVIFIKDNKEVILLGVSHIAEKEYYEKINKRYSENYLILIEGINFEDSSENEEISHSHSAKILGLTPQDKLFLKNYPYKNVDINANELNGNVIKALSSSFSFWENLSIFNFKELKTDLNNFGEISFTELYHEVIIKRNLKIKQEILSNNNNLVIPWGAIHQNDLENFLLKQGYSKKSTNFIKIANLPKLLYNSIKFFLKGKQDD